MFAFLGHLQRTTVDSQADVKRLSRGMTIRRAKKRKYIINDTRTDQDLQVFQLTSFSFNCLHNIVVAYNVIFASVSIDIFAFSCVHKQCL